jgi:ribonuclease E
MSKRMLIDAAHPEEIRVAILNGNRLEEFDVEAAGKRQIKGNIYLARVTRVEPSLQAAFVEYGGNRHGFLAFNEIHPDYYRIPVSDRAAFKSVYEPRSQGESEGETESAEIETTAVADAEVETGPGDEGGTSGQPGYEQALEAAAAEAEAVGPPVAAASSSDDVIYDSLQPETTEREVADIAVAPLVEPGPPRAEAETANDTPAASDTIDASDASPAIEEAPPVLDIAASHEGDAAPLGEAPQQIEVVPEVHMLETIGGDDGDAEEAEAPRPRFRSHRHYKIQEVVKRRQIMLVQVTKEERGNKGAALTTYLSLAGRYCVLMPNTPRGGGVSRKITSIQDRRRLKDLMSDLQVPDGMGVIVRTAGSERSKPEIKRDFEYLLRLWDEIRDLTLKSTAPALVYEEGNLIKRSIRDLYSRDIEEVVVDGEEGYRAAKDFMKMLMPSHAKRVKLYRDPSVPLLHRYQAEGQIDAILSPVVQLRSGGYIVINPTEALVAIDVNSGRATRERNIEETALKTNLEAAEEVARQLRLRDLAGLIVVDFIDMEEGRNNAQVERRIKDAMRHDRARIQIGRISPFGLMELSRQRLRPSLLEASTEPCPHCGGTGHVRSTESTALHILRAIEEEGMRRRSAEVTVAVPINVAIYLLNQKREALTQNEKRYCFRITIDGDEALVPPAFRLDRGRPLTAEEIAALPALTSPLPLEEEEDTGEDESDSDAFGITEPVSVAGPPVFAIEEEETEAAAPQPPQSERASRHRRHRQRREHVERNLEQRTIQEAPPSPSDESEESDLPIAADASDGEAPATLTEGDGRGDRKRRRRGRRGGRRRRREQGTGAPPDMLQAAIPVPGEPIAVALAPVMEATDTEVLGATEADQDIDVAAELPSVANPEPATLENGLEQQPNPQEPEPEPPPQSKPDPEPAGPPRHGWWRRRGAG